MLKFLMSFGVMLSVGSGYVAYDYSKQASGKPGKVLLMNDYRPSLPFGVVNLMAKPPREGIASLPQVPRGMATQSMKLDANTPSTREQIDDFVKDNPQLQAMVSADRAAAKKSWWARIRQKVEPDKPAVRTNRLGAIRERNFPTRRQGIEPSALAGLSPWQLFSKRNEISQGLSATAANRMNDAAKAMKDMGYDPSQ